SFDDHVLQRAAKMGLAPWDTCNHFHDAIQRDFDFLDIEFDAFINPVSPEWRDPFFDAHARVVNRLLERGAARRQDERFLAAGRTGDPVLGSDLSGRCARCGSATVGFVCEHCGLQVTTEMLESPRALSGGPVSWRTGTTLALNVTDRRALLQAIAAMTVPPEFK